MSHKIALLQTYSRHAHFCVGGFSVLPASPFRPSLPSSSPLLPPAPLSSPSGSAGNKCVQEFVGTSGPMMEWSSRMKSQMPVLKFDKAIQLNQ